MKIYYQWEKWAYSHIVSNEISKFYNINKDNIIWCFSFQDMFDNIKKNNWIAIVPIENSYAGSVYENFNILSKGQFEIIWEYYLNISHCLLSISSDKNTIKKVYSHYQALMQCEKYLKDRNLQPVVFGDTAWSAKYVKEQNKNELACISSSLAWKIYWLNILEENINDQDGNTTRFLIVVPKKMKIKKFSNNWKMSILFKVKDVSAVLYKCLGAFATQNINLTKIESLSTKENQFEYMFWLDFEFPQNKEQFDEVLQELSYFAKDIKILWKY